jgi:Intrinsic membrane protein PufX
MMSEKPYYAEDSHGRMLRAWVLGQMMRGAGLAAVFVLVLGLGLYALYGIGLLLPAESRETPAPMGAVIVMQPTAYV